jgi:hypothetical protein
MGLPISAVASAASWRVRTMPCSLHWLLAIRGELRPSKARPGGIKLRRNRSAPARFCGRVARALDERSAPACSSRPSNIGCHLSPSVRDAAHLRARRPLRYASPLKSLRHVMPFQPDHLRCMPPLLAQCSGYNGGKTSGAESSSMSVSGGPGGDAPSAGGVGAAPAHAIPMYRAKRYGAPICAAGESICAILGRISAGSSRFLVMLHTLRRRR